MAGYNLNEGLQVPTGVTPNIYAVTTFTYLYNGDTIADIVTAGYFDKVLLLQGMIIKENDKIVGKASDGYYELVISKIDHNNKGAIITVENRTPAVI